MLFEDVVLRKNIGQGLGGMAGRFLGAFGGGFAGGLLGGPVGIGVGMGLGTSIGGQAGRLVGGNVISDPNRPADFSNATDRVGYLANAYSKPLAAIADAVTGPSPIPTIANATEIGAGLYNAVSDNGAKRLGYQMPGRIGLGIASVVPYVRDFAPLAGIVPPDKVAKNK